MQRFSRIQSGKEETRIGGLTSGYSIKCDGKKLSVDDDGFNAMEEEDDMIDVEIDVVFVGDVEVFDCVLFEMTGEWCGVHVIVGLGLRGIVVVGVFFLVA